MCTSRLVDQATPANRHSSQLPAIQQSFHMQPFQTRARKNLKLLEKVQTYSWGAWARAAANWALVICAKQGADFDDGIALFLNVVQELTAFVQSSYFHGLTL